MNRSKLFCTIRKRWVHALPEEIIRQRLIAYLIQEMQAPPSLISVEKSLENLAPLHAKQLPKRRVDVIVYRVDSSSAEIKPLLMIECKADSLGDKALLQLMGYNYYIQSPYIALADQKGISFFSFDTVSKEYQPLASFFSYMQLVKKEETC